MKKLISILLSVVMILSVASVAFAAEEVVPVIIVSGMGRPLYEVQEDGSQVTVWGPDTQKVIKAALEVTPHLLYAMATDDFSDLPNRVDSIKGLFEPVAHNSDGSLKHNIVCDIYPESLDNYADVELFAERQNGEACICATVADEIGAENTYFFNYNWTDGAITLGSRLNDYIENVKKEKNCDKVKLIACSMGGTVTMAYLADYGYDSVDTVILASTAFLGTEIVGQLFTKKIDVSVNSLFAYFGEFLGSDLTVTLLDLMQKLIDTYDSNLIPNIDVFLDKLAANLDCILYSDLFMDTFVTMPGFWSLMPASYYEEARQVLFIEREEYSFIKNEIDHYMYDVQLEADEIINEARDTGVNFYIVSAYLCPGIPVYENSNDYTDNLIDLKYASGFATVATYGSYIDLDSPNPNKVCSDESHNHISADLIVDASSCILPEQTWIIKNVGHMSYDYQSPMCGLLAYLVTSEDYVDIYSNENYPQFTEYDKKNNTFISLTNYIEDIPERNTVGDLIKLLIKQLGALLKNLLGIGK